MTSPEEKIVASQKPMDEQGTANRGHEDHSLSGVLEVDLRSIIWVIIRGKWIILACTILVMAYSTYSLTKFLPHYQAQLLVNPSDYEQSLRLPASVNRLTAAVGIRLPAEASKRFDQLSVILGSVALAKRLDEEFGYLKIIFDGNWDPETGAPKPPDNFNADIDAFFRKFVNIPEWVAPTHKSLAAYIKDNVIVEPVGIDSAIRQISYLSPDKDFALEFLANVYSSAEEMMRESGIERVTRQLEYLRQKLAQITVSDYRLSILGLISEQEKRMMVLNAGLPFVGEILDPPSASDQPTRPRPIFTMAFGLIGGIIIGIVLVLVIRFARFVLSRPPPG